MGGGQHGGGHDTRRLEGGNTWEGDDDNFYDDKPASKCSSCIHMNDKFIIFL